MALVEWEFTEGEDSDGTFMATGKVIEQLRRHLAKGEVDEAVQLYESCVQETVGKELWDEFQTASVSMRKSIANLFYRSRDFHRAGLACEQLGEWGAAAKAYAACYDWTKAATALLEKGDRAGATAMLEKAGEHHRAAQMHFADGRVMESAECLERASDFVGAGQLFLRAGQDARAVRVLDQVSAQDPRFVQAVGLASEALVRMGRPDLAAGRLESAIPEGTPIQHDLTAEVAYRLGRLCWEAGRTAEAARAFERVLAYRSTYKDAQDCLQGVKSGAAAPPTAKPSAAPAAPATLPVVAGTPSGAHPVVSPSGGFAAVTPRPAASDPSGERFPPPSGEVRAPPAAEVTRLDRPPPGAAPPAEPPPHPMDVPTIPVEGPPPPAQTVPLGYVQRMPGYEVLKALPIFSDLTLEEMRSFYEVCAQAGFRAGEVIIEQGQPGPGLVISRAGRMQVVSVGEDGRETELATLTPGSYVGEMSLLDEAPTSARVKALDPVRALVVERARFAQFLFDHDRIALRVYRSFAMTLSDRLRQQNVRR